MDALYFYSLESKIDFSLLIFLKHVLSSLLLREYDVSQHYGDLGKAGIKVLNVDHR